MKKLSKLKLSAFREQNLVEKQMNALRGGRYCSCSCYYANSGGSSVANNMGANYNIGDDGGASVNGCNCYITYDYWPMPIIDPDGPYPYNQQV
jgi:natural product precursor